MKKVILSCILLLASSVRADTCSVGSIGPFTAAQASKLCKNFPYNASASNTPSVSIDATRGITYSSSTQETHIVPFVPTLVATPVAGTNDFRSLSIVPTVAANAAGCLPTPSATVSDTYNIFNNNAANAIRVKACGTPGMNGGASGTYISVPAQSLASCRSSSATNYNCTVSAVVPTPAGP